MPAGWSEIELGISLGSQPDSDRAQRPGARTPGAASRARSQRGTLSVR
jgi:hypothetical protein